MPAALYASILTEQDRNKRVSMLTKSETYWHAIAQLVGAGKAGTELRDKSIAAFAAMIPDTTGIRDPRIGLWPINLVRLCPRAPTLEQWHEIAANYDYSGMNRRLKTELITLSWHKGKPPDICGLMTGNYPTQIGGADE